MSKIKSFMVPIYVFLNSIVGFLYLRAHGVETRYGYVKLSGLPTIMKYPGSKIILGKGVQLISLSRFNPAGINHPVILATRTKDAIIEMRDYSGASGVTINAVKSVIVESFALIGVNSTIYDTDFHCVEPTHRKNQNSIEEAKSAPVIIGENAWIGANTMVLKGVAIGRNCIIGACSVVTKSVPDNEIVAGNPAKTIRKVTKE